MTAPRVRFAPSPTGFFHVGSARTALFNWLFARGNRGVFVLRIEDTDVERNREEWVGGIESALEWLQMAPDEGPFRQSAQDERHRVAIDALFEAGFLYACDCTREEIAERTKDNPTPGYDGYCRERHLERGPTTALRFKTPPEGSTTVVDLIRGEIVFPHSAMDDFVAVKSTGQPLFALANVIDDRDMGITHVIRGEDLLPTTPRQLLLWAALDGGIDIAELHAPFASQELSLIHISDHPRRRGHRPPARDRRFGSRGSLDRHAGGGRVRARGRADRAHPGHPVLRARGS